MANDKWSGSNPWLGLAPYTEGTPLYGRTKESVQLADIIKDYMASVVFGKSGIGKSSLLSAGISPLLREENYIPVRIRLVHNTDVSYIDQIEGKVRETVQCIDCLPSDVNNLGLWDFFHRHSFTTENGINCIPVIILDQFEEIYTLTDADHKKDIITFFNELSSLLNDIKPDNVIEEERNHSAVQNGSASSTPKRGIIKRSAVSTLNYTSASTFRFVICLREDKLYLLERNSANIPSLKANRYNLQALSPESALEVIMCPRPELFSNEEATAIVDKLADMGDEGLQTVDPAILSLFLYKYYEKQGQANYDNIFADYYQEATKDIKGKSIAFLEDHLLTLGGYRNQVPLDDALSSGVTQEDIQSLLQSIIIRKEQRKGIDYIEFSHDRLCAEAMHNREARLQKGKYLKVISYIVVSIIICLFLFAAYNYLRTIDLNEKLESTNNELNTKSELLQLSSDSLLLETNRNSMLIDSLTFQNVALSRLMCINQLQKDSLADQVTIVKILNDSLNAQKEILREKYKLSNELAIHYKQQSDSLLTLSRMLESKNKALQSQQEIINLQAKENGIINTYIACISLREAYANMNLSAIAQAIRDLDACKTAEFGSLRVRSGEEADIKGHLVFNSAFANSLLAGKQDYSSYRSLSRGQILNGATLTKTCCIKASQTISFCFNTRGHEEIAFVTEPNGLISVKVYDATRKETLYDSTSDKTGSPFHMFFADFSNEKRTALEVQVINRSTKNISFVVISN